MKRRLFALALGVATLVASIGVGEAAPGERIVRIGIVDSRSPSTGLHGIAALWERLRVLGWVEGENLVVERRWADGKIERLPALMDEMVARKVDVLITFGTPAAVAAKNATSTIPIVVAAVYDPVATGLAASLARPGGNLTGLSLAYAGTLSGKWLELLQETVPRLATVAVISNPNSPAVQKTAKELIAAASARSLKLTFIAVREPQALDRAFNQAQREAQAVFVLSDPLTTTHRETIAALATKHRLPAIYQLRDFVDAGGLIAYAPDLTVQFRRAAEYVDKILKGATPGDMPIEQPTQYVLIVNLKAAKALGLTIPDSILLRADEVIR